MGPGGPRSPLFLDQTEAPKAGKKFFWRLPPPPFIITCSLPSPTPSPLPSGASEHVVKIYIRIS